MQLYTQVYARVLFCIFEAVCTYIHEQYIHIHTYVNMYKSTRTYTRAAKHVQITTTLPLPRTYTLTYTRTDTALDRLTDPGVEFKGHHRSKVSSHGDSERLLDGDALDATATKLQVTTCTLFSIPLTISSVPIAIFSILFIISSTTITVFSTPLRAVV